MGCISGTPQRIGVSLSALDGGNDALRRQREVV
jgi:hypothetical protein